MRIGTWNLAGRWSPRHRRLIEDGRCDVWLLTEVGAKTALGGDLVRSGEMPGRARRSWAAVWSPDALAPCPPVHEAAALARWGDLLVCSCVLPWRAAGATWPDDAPNTAGRTIAALERLRAGLVPPAAPLVWGGDWNHAMSGTEHAGSAAGRAAIGELVADAGLTVATAALPHHIDGALSIDHIAVPKAWTVVSATRLDAATDGRRLSDHDAYVVEVAPR